MQVANTGLLGPEQINPLGSFALKSPMSAGGGLARPARVGVLLTSGLLIFAEGPICLRLEKAQRAAGINSKLRVTAF